MHDLKFEEGNEKERKTQRGKIWEGEKKKNTFFLSGFTYVLY